jgi:hypothetical protein
VIDRDRSGYRVEPLGASHDRASFHSGVPELDRYLHEQAGQDARRRVAAPFVLIDPSGAVMGYYTLSAYSVRLGELPEAIAKNLPRYPLLPATLLGRLAASISCRGQRLGAFLLMDALYRSWKNTSRVGWRNATRERESDALPIELPHREGTARTRTADLQIKCSSSWFCRAQPVQAAHKPDSV